MKISLVIPIGQFSYFVNACLQNVLETSGAELDFVFLTSKDIAPEIATALKEAEKFYSFRIISAPFNSGANHLRLLDWAFRNADLSDWVIVQHCDLFWREHGWLNRILSTINSNTTVLCTPCKSNYYIGSENIPIVGDFFGTYNRPQFVKENLSFNWGTLGTDVPVSAEVTDAIHSGLIHREDNLKIEFGKEFMDGSQAIGWELAIHSPERIQFINLSFLHLVGVFRMAEAIRRTPTTLTCIYPLHFDAYAYYSYLMSFCVERNECEQFAIPWVIFKRIARIHNVDLNKQEEVGKWLRRYSSAKNVIGLDDLGIEQVIHFSGKYSARPVKFL
jgi:hypothetical protein